MVENQYDKVVKRSSECRLHKLTGMTCRQTGGQAVRQADSTRYGEARLSFSPRICGLNPQEILNAPQEILLIYPALLSRFQGNSDIPHFCHNFRKTETSCIFVVISGISHFKIFHVTSLQLCCAIVHVSPA